MSKKEIIHYTTAVGMICFGCLMCFLSFILDPKHVVDDSVLWILGQALLFAGGVFGLGLYVNNRVEQTFRKFSKSQQKGGGENGI